MSSHTVTIQRTEAVLVDRWEVRVNGGFADWTLTHWGAVQLAKRKLRALDRGAEVYMVPDKREWTP